MSIINPKPIGVKITSKIIFVETTMDQANEILIDIENLIDEYVKLKYSATVVSGTGELIMKGDW